MKERLMKIIVLGLVCVFVAAGTAAGQEKRPFGIIFSTGSILMEIQSYQAGVGIKLPGDQVDLRLGADVFAANSFNTFSVGGGIAVEKHFRPGKASPYYGGFAHVGFTSQKDETDKDNWVQNSTLTASGGGILGVEFFLLENLSIFGEYALAADMSNITTKTTTDGKTEESSDFSITIDTRIGNSSKIGVVIYVK
jgi:hypothetical protein